jgi:CRISPR-associated protein (TIGR03986 family)
MCFIDVNHTVSPDGHPQPRTFNVIYCTSLKGVIRSVAEAVSQSCFPIGDGGKCTDPKQLCTCCRMFGWLNRGDVFAGRVHISDARPEGDWKYGQSEYIAPHALSSPKPHHGTFYQKEGKPRGRKFYYHQQGESHIQRQGQTSIIPAPAGAVFRFDVDFADLDAAELGLLIYTLELEPELYHKIGKAKPLGLGTADITIEPLWLYPPNRCEVFDAEPQEQSTTFKTQRVADFFNGHFGISYEKRTELPHIQDLLQMLAQHDDYRIHYPTQAQFGNQELPTALEVAQSPENWLKEEP